jgi:peptide-methionine (S)-S-oxide reductase
MATEIAVFGSGCFWCSEAIFQRLRGVKTVTSGYAGGTVDNPSYEDVSTGRTQHAEVVKLEFDPSIIKYEDLLDIFWHIHDPTTLNKQGADVGTQYRSIILTTTKEQEKTANEMKKTLDHSKEFKDSIVTEIKPLTTFFTAEDYHKNYFIEHPEASYCQLVIAPKVKHFLEKYGDKTK